ncbi:hypothetical protein ACB098_09G161600 [Castanea mollissima]
MAGLQYNFFPTDFFYPRPKSVAIDTTTPKAVLPLQQDPIREVTNDIEVSKTLVQKNPVKKVIPLTLTHKSASFLVNKDPRRA